MPSKAASSTASRPRDENGRFKAAAAPPARARAPARKTSAASFGGFDAASIGRRTKNWYASAASINTLLQGSLSTIRDRSRDQARNNPWVKRAARSYVSNIVGTGIRPIPKTPDEAFNKALSELWNDWAREADADRLLDFYGLQSLVVRSFRTSGEALIRKVYRPTDQYDLPLPFQIQVIEPDHLNHLLTQYLDNGAKIVQGVEFDADGNRVAYHLWKQHPQELLAGFGSAEMIRVPASEILHIFEPERPGQVRGYPGMASTIIRMLDMGEFEDAELIRKKITSMIVGFITTPAGEDGTVVIGGATDANSCDPNDPDAVPVPTATLEPGTIQALAPGEGVEFNNPKDTPGSFEPFVQMMLRAAAAGSDVTYEQMTGDLRGCNFSSLRAGLNDVQRIMEQVRDNIFIHQLCVPVWREFVLWAVKTGAVSLPKNFTAQRRAYQRADWRAPGWPYVSPLDESRASLIDVRSGWSSRAHEAALRGFDINELDAQNAADNTRSDALGLVFDSDARQTNLRGQVQTTPPPDEESQATKEDNAPPAQPPAQTPKEAEE